MPPNKQGKDTEFSEQALLNRSYDPVTAVLAYEPITYDGTSNPQRQISKEVATKITTSGTVTYVAKAPIGTSQSSASWQAKKIVASGADTTVTWADGDANFDNIATDLTVLTYT